MSTITTPIVSLHHVELIPLPPEYLPPANAKRRFDASRAMLGATLGLKRLGCNVTQVASGCVAYPFHSHRANDELFLVLAGRGELWLGKTQHAVKEGDLIGCPAGGPETAHQLVNTGSEPLRYLALSSQIDPDICEYPDSGKVGAYHGEGEAEFMHLTRSGDQVDYWHGE
jgi:uncharacterized cupin superfamily protein